MTSLGCSLIGPFALSLAALANAAPIDPTSVKPVTEQTETFRGAVDGATIIDPWTTGQMGPEPGVHFEASRVLGILQIIGPIEVGYDITVASYLRTYLTKQQALGSKGRVVVQLVSLGGDIETALKIGRIVRNARATTVVLWGRTCASACVLIYAAGSARILNPGHLIIHRPYLTGLAAGDESDTAEQYKRMRSEVKRYLEDMNVSPEFFDLMQSIPPSDQRELSASEAKQFGLVETDPIEEELKIGERARRSGISREEVRRRDVLANELIEKNCKTPDKFDDKSQLENLKCMIEMERRVNSVK